MNKTFLTVLIMLALIAVGCGSGGGKTPVTVGGQHLVDPSGNWKMSFTDSNNNLFILSGLYSQSGPVVTGLSFSEVGNLAPGFQCLVQRDISMANGLVQNTNQFSGDLSGNFGTIHFSSTLNDPGTHASGTYTVTPPANGNCLGIALTGTFTGDEVPSVTGNWTGTINCVADCPVGATTGTITFNLTQHDDTGVVNGSYTITGLPGLSNGSLVPNTIPENNFISGANIEEQMLDANGTTLTLAGGPFNSGFQGGGAFQDNGLGLDRSMACFLIVQGSQAVYTVNANH
jgi:hypothetical protein